LKNNAVVGSKVKDRSLLRVDFKRGQVPRGSRGRTGARGLPGAAGAPGPRGPPGLSALELVSQSSDSNSDSPKDERTQCPSGKNIIGGGVVVSGDAENSVAVTRSGPVPSAQQWSVKAHEHSGTDDVWTLTAFAFCAIVAS
jgi:hypothetical protein